MKFAGEKKTKTYGVFSGEGVLTPIMFNPSSEQIKTLKQLEEVNEPQYFNITGPNNTNSTRLQLWLEFDPNKQMGTEQYKTSYVTYDILIAKEEVSSKEGKFQLIDDRLKSCWIAIDKRKSIESQILEVREEKRVALEKDNKEPSKNDGLFNINEKTARIACYGELALLRLIYVLSSLSEKEEDFQLSLGENPTKTFHEIVDGNFDILNNLFTNKKYASIFTTNGKINQVVGLLGAIKKNDKIYQKLYNQSPLLGEVSLNRLQVKPKDIKDAKYILDGKEHTIVGKSKLEKGTWKSILDEKYGWMAKGGFFKDSTTLQQITIDDMPSDGSNHNDVNEMTNDFGNLPLNPFDNLPSIDGDLPF